jgi:hypothetical protein
MILTYLFICILSLKTSAQPDTRRHFRTDGIYFFDNGIDTLNLIKDGLKMQLEMIQNLQSEGIIPARPFTHNDSIAINAQGSCAVHFMAFFNDTSGTYFFSNDRKNGETKECIDLIETWRKITTHDTIINTKDVDSLKQLDFHTHTRSFRNIHYINDTTIEFVPTGRGYSFMERIAQCTIRKDGHMRVKVLSPIDPTFVMSDDLYIFIPYDKIPPDLVEAKRYFELKK